jgi:hypothetical protein
MLGSEVTKMWTPIRCVVAMLALLLPTEAFAQPLPDWAERIELGKPLFITMTSGDRVEGIAGQVTTGEVVVATPMGIRTVRYAEIRKVEKRDSVWSGVAIGTAVGLGIGILWRASIDCGSPTCSNEANAVIGGGAFYGALFGWGIDKALKGRQTLFQSNESPNRVSLSVRPGAIGVRAVIAW